MDLGRFSAILVVGAPGSGKGTQARFLCEALRIPHVATGDLLREHRRRGTALGIAARASMDNGDLVPDELVIQTVVERLYRPDAANGVVLDGFPRTLEQARLLDRQLEAGGGGVRSVLYLAVPETSLIERLTGRRVCIGCQGTFHVMIHALPPDGTCPRCGDQLVQRPDDREEIIRHRVAVYLDQTRPVLEHYAERGVVHHIDGARGADEIKDDILNRLTGHVATLV